MQSCKIGAVLVLTLCPVPAISLMGCDSSGSAWGDADAQDSSDLAGDTVLDGDGIGPDVPFDSADAPWDESWDTGTDDGSTDVEVPSECVITSDLGFSMLTTASWQGHSVVDEAHDVLLVLPTYVGPSTDHLTAVSLVTGEEQTLSIELAGEVPLLYVVALTYDVTSARTVVLAYDMARPGDGGIGDHMEMFTIALDGAGGATVGSLEPTSAPDSEGAMFSWLLPEGDGSHYRAFRYGASSFRATVAGSAVTWEPEVTLTMDGMFDMNRVSHDATGNRLLVYGEMTIEGVPPDFTQYLDPGVFALSIAGGTNWSRLPASGPAPARQESLYWIVPAVALYDDTGDRLVVLQDHPYVDPWIGETMVTGLWTFSDAGIWTAVDENMGYCCASFGTAIDDRERRRALALTGSGLSGIDLSPGNEGETFGLDTGSPLAPDVSSAAFDPDSGSIIASAEWGLWSMAVRAGDFVWREADGGQDWPTTSSIGHTLVIDEAGRNAVIFGGSDSVTTTETNDVWTLDLDTPASGWEHASPGGTVPAPRTWHSAIVDEATRTMYVAGGYTVEGYAVTDLAEVDALDLATMTWRHLATLPSGRSTPLLRLAPGGGELFVMFGDRHPNPADPYTLEYLRDALLIDTSTGAISTLAVAGPLPTLSSSVMAGLDLPSGWVVVSPEAYGVETYSATFSTGTVSFERFYSCEDSRSFAWGGAGVVDPSTGLGYVVGTTVWQVGG